MAKFFRRLLVNNSDLLLFIHLFIRSVDPEGVAASDKDNIIRNLGQLFAERAFLFRHHFGDKGLVAAGVELVYKDPKFALFADVILRLRLQ